jgi:hypothetical protein
MSATDFSCMPTKILCSCNNGVADTEKYTPDQRKNPNKT